MVKSNEFSYFGSKCSKTVVDENNGVFKKIYQLVETANRWLERL